MSEHARAAREAAVAVERIVAEAIEAAIALVEELRRPEARR